MPTKAKDAALRTADGITGPLPEVEESAYAPDAQPLEPIAQPAKVFTFPAVVPDADGYYHAARWIRVVCEWEGLAPREGTEPLWAEIDASLTFNEAMRIPNPFETPYVELAAHVAPRVRAWNARMVDPATGELVPAPTPSETGMQAFYDVNIHILVWLAFTLRTLHIAGGPNRGKETKQSDGTSDGPNDGA